MKKRIDSYVAAIVRWFHIYTDVILGFVLAAFSVAMLVTASSIKIMKEPVSVVDTARFFPRLIFGSLLLVGIVILAKGIGKVKTNRGTIPTGQDLEDAVIAFERGVVTLASIAVFIALMQPIGFIPTAILYMIFSMFFMSVKEGWKPAAYVITAVMVAAVCYFLFRKFVYVHLPDGILKGVLG